MFLPGTLVNINKFADTNKALIIQGKRPATGKPLLLGITKASLETVVQSYIPSRNNIIEKLKNPEFIELHQNLEIELMQKLSPSKEKHQVKAKEVTHG